MHTLPWATFRVSITGDQPVFPEPKQGSTLGMSLVQHHRCIRAIDYPAKLMNCSRVRPKIAIRKSISHFQSRSAAESREQNFATEVGISMVV